MKDIEKGQGREQLGRPGREEKRLDEGETNRKKRMEGKGMQRRVEH